MTTRIVPVPVFEHVPNGDFSAWDSPTQPTGWTVTLAGGGAVQRSNDPASLAPGATWAAEFTTNAAAGDTATISRGISSLIPGSWYLVSVYRFALRPDTGGSVTGPANQGITIYNTTRTRSMTPATLNAVSVLVPQTQSLTGNWSPQAGVLLRKYEFWCKVPTVFGSVAFSSGDAWGVRVGIATGSGSQPRRFAYSNYSILGPYGEPSHVQTPGTRVTVPELAPRVAVSLVSPSGVSFDLTERIDLGGVGTITEGAEEQLLQLTHGDVTLTVRDEDGLVESLVANASTSDRWTVIVERERPADFRRRSWERIFAGVLDLPWSVQTDPVEKTVKLQVFSFSKVAEQTSAEGVRRTFSTLTGSVTSGAATVTLSPGTSGIVRDDIVKLEDGTSTESFTVLAILNATQFTATTNAGGTFASAGATVETPFYRDATPATLVGLVIDALPASAGRSVDLAGVIAPFPVSTPLNSQGLKRAARPLSLVPQGGNITATYLVADEANRRIAASPTAGFTAGVASNFAQGDWTPYLLAEPGSIWQHEGTGITTRDAGLWGWDHDASRRYWIGISSFPSGPYTTFRLSLRYNAGLTEGTLWEVSTAVDTGWAFYHGDLDPGNQRYWFSARSDGGVEKGLRYKTIGGAVVTIDTTTVGECRCCIHLNSMLVFHEDQTTLSMYDLTTRTLLRSIALPAGYGAAQASTARYLDGCLVWVCRNASGVGSSLAILDCSTWTFHPLVAVSAVSSPTRANASTAPTSFLTRYPSVALGRDVLVGQVGGEWIVVSRYFDGVIPYADFSGKSVAGALVEIAAATLGIFRVDEYDRIAFGLRADAFDAAARHVLDAAPLSESRRIVWEFYRESAEVTGKTPAGVAFSQVGGATGASARRIEIESSLIGTPGFAFAIASAYSGFFSVVREQCDVKIRELDEPIRVLDVVAYDGRDWLVSEVKTDITNREVSLRLFEVK